MKPILSLAAFLLLASPASAQSFRYFDNRGNQFAGQATPYGTVFVDPYGYRAWAVPYYRPVYPAYYGYGVNVYSGWGLPGYPTAYGYVVPGMGW